MFKRLIVLIIAGVLTGIVSAQVLDTAEVVVGVATVTAFDLSTTEVDLTLDWVSGPTYVSDTDNTGSLSFSHNLEAAQTITVVAAYTGIVNNDIELSVRWGEGSGNWLVLFEDNASTGAQDLDTGLVRGVTYTETLSWRAEASVALTPAGSYPFTITFTLVDDD